jgi:hypothetical protein
MTKLCITCRRGWHSAHETRLGDSCLSCDCEWKPDDGIHQSRIVPRKQRKVEPLEVLSAGWVSA